MILETQRCIYLPANSRFPTLRRTKALKTMLSMVPLIPKLPQHHRKSFKTSIKPHGVYPSVNKVSWCLSTHLRRISYQGLSNQQTIV
ncbi:hypothetical protein PanWU01x14_014080 [Parasponia andersonii]|uniref:Uncharacterized protein n=1 Tax=Parasponia andersonii TaxID=3476 RepID=A0A2P5E188_PARAD|nr:hypothetical protein PanWU01x14_014080 [Parasponia andersonii]